ncbi:acetyltransferase [Methylobacterium sp. Leaf399]|uniref:GNAT family N-acetyltransferase n=1 Tax=unclassified Methylobacterium TaxID=2615210 RepID=UPI0006F554DF|nr:MULTISPECIES: GNAT family N-acetyltransferase [unclassified Methylobacterium]KQP48862.1 acetyltransferase [Methylobacterium sp. Leaf108]KQT16555.1 acetyltransferase [Methylobacterium sp. Leaf399]
MLTIRDAEADDLAAIVALYAADTLGGHGDAWTDGNKAHYRAALAAITAAPGTSLHVAVEDGDIVGVFQLVSFVTLAGRGARRAKLASVQVRADRRSRGIGAWMIGQAEDIARRQGVALIELSSSRLRHDAHRFYDRLGYERGHEGFRKRL